MVAALGTALGVALALLRLRALILVPVVLALLLMALVDMDAGPVLAAVCVQVGYLLGSLLLHVFTGR